jgi:hypothetical protein
MLADFVLQTALQPVKQPARVGSARAALLSKKHSFYRLPHWLELLRITSFTHLRFVL